MILIPDEIRTRLRVLAGAPERLSNIPVPPWDASRVGFLADLSKTLLAMPESRTLPDVVTFAYWTRKANLEALRIRSGHQDRARLGLGLVFHVCPSNVPINFAFSMAFGLLAGNSGVLRLPSADTPTADLLVKAVATLLDDPRHAALGEALALLRYERDEAVNAFWSSQADGRIIWGGDDTVQAIRGLPSPPRCRDVSFPDRYSLCVLRPEAILGLDGEALVAFCNSLYNDIYLMDQAACSSPQLVVWVGDRDRVASAQSRLWPSFADHVARRHVFQPIQVMDKFVLACESASTDDNVRGVSRHGSALYRIELNGIARNQDQCRGYSGTIHEVVLSSLAELVPAVSDRYQTLTYFGYDHGALAEFVVSHGLRGIDRIVPVGRALDMDVIWDGYDILAHLSRIVDVR